MLYKEFVPYKQALALKELGFDEPCFAFHNHNEQLIMMSQENEGEISIWKNSYVPLGKQYAAPTFSQAFRWFREKYGLLSYLDKCLTNTFRYNLDLNDSMIGLSGYKTYEEAELACLIKLIEIVKEKK